MKKHLDFFTTRVASDVTRALLHVTHTLARAHHALVSAAVSLLTLGSLALLAPSTAHALIPPSEWLRGDQPEVSLEKERLQAFKTALESAKTPAELVEFTKTGFRYFLNDKTVQKIFLALVKKADVVTTRKLQMSFMDLSSSLLNPGKDLFPPTDLLLGVSQALTLATHEDRVQALKALFAMNRRGSVSTLLSVGEIVQIDGQKYQVLALTDRARGSAEFRVLGPDDRIHLLKVLNYDAQEELRLMIDDYQKYRALKRADGVVFTTTLFNGGYYQLRELPLGLNGEEVLAQFSSDPQNPERNAQVATLFEVWERLASNGNTLASSFNSGFKLKDFVLTENGWVVTTTTQSNLGRTRQESLEAFDTAREKAAANSMPCINALSKSRKKSR